MIEPFYGTLRPADKASGAAQIYHIANETGTGKLTVCPVFAGVELCYNDMHLAWCNQDQQAARNVIEINHCRMGRYECSFGENSCCYLAAEAGLSPTALKTCFKGVYGSSIYAYLRQYRRLHGSFRGKLCGRKHSILGGRSCFFGCG